MTPRISFFLKKYSTDINVIDKLFVSAYLKVNGYNVRNNDLLKSYIISNDNNYDLDALNTFISIIQKEQSSFTLENLIELFEFVISPAEKEVNGAVYTPKYIREYITNKCFNSYKQNIVRAIK